MCTGHGTAAAAGAPADFLQGASYKKHPGVTALKTVRLPEDLQRGALSVIHGAALRELPERARRLSNFLWSRKRATDEAALRKKALDLEKRLLEQEVEKGGDGDRYLTDIRIRKEVLSQLKKTTYHWTPVRYDDELSIIYLAARLAGGYAAVRRALNEIKKRDDLFSPCSLLDFGSGLGTVVWAVHATWGDTLKESVCVDSSKAMNTLAERLLRGDSETKDPLLKQVYFRQFLPVTPTVQFDLVVSAFALSELASKQERAETVLTLWRKTHSYMVLVENGTKEGHQILMEARDTVLKVIFLLNVFCCEQCAHQFPCPKLAQEPQLPCNYPQAYRPLPLPGNPEHEVECFSYLVVARQETTREDKSLQWARLIRPVLRRPRHVHCHVCCPDGKLRHLVVTDKRNGRAMYRCARSSDYGDRLPLLQSEDESLP
uniref:Ribosome assembly protein METTL17, mitochondrial n=1 Tax=Scleropages formosus TaxID=113540 RepID=A0A8C9WR40_SCLFO